jgi:biopolymer transport protein ExbD
VLGEEEAIEIDLAPMIDCVFLLLIFFLVTTAFVDERGLEVSKPDVAASVSQHSEEKLILEITAENRILLDGAEIDSGEVSRRVRAVVVKAPDLPVVIRVHEKSHHGTFVSLWDAARRGGAEMLSFTTTN